MDIFFANQIVVYGLTTKVHNGNVYNVHSLLLLMAPRMTYANQCANHIWK